MRYTFVLGVLLALAGLAFALTGIQVSEFKPFITGMVLLAGAGVFAILSLGARRADLAEREPPAGNS